ncbi:hypothetical protein B194_4853 [Serratia plymuthica A30]|nr:hypothetical protein B194_4853 [Serratia plymuthica A30]
MGSPQGNTGGKLFPDGMILMILIHFRQGFLAAYTANLEFF